MFTLYLSAHSSFPTTYSFNKYYVIHAYSLRLYFIPMYITVPVDFDDMSAI